MLDNLPVGLKSFITELVSLGDEVFQQFVDLSTKAILHGFSLSAATKAAKTLGTDANSIQMQIHALSQLLLFLVEKRAVVSFTDFANLEDIPWSDKKIKMFHDNYVANRELLRTTIENTPGTRSYRSLDWRLDVQLASRCVYNRVDPVFLFELETTEENGKGSNRLLFESDFANVQHLRKQLQSALEETRQMHYRSVSRATRFQIKT